MVVCASVRTTNYHDGSVTCKEAKITDGRFEEMTVLLEPYDIREPFATDAPFGEVYRRGKGHSEVLYNHVRVCFHFL